MPRRTLPVMVLVAVISLLAFAAAVHWAWLGPDTGAGANFCEAAHGGAIRQPANTFSNLGFVAAGILAAAHFDRVAARLSRPALLAGFPALIVLLGPGSMAMHATQSNLGGRLDVGSMYLVAGFAAGYAITRVLHRGPRSLAVLFVVLVAAAEVLGSADLSAPLVDTVGNLVFAALLIVAVAVEVWLRRRTGHPGSLGAAALALGAMVAAFTIWSFSHTGGPLCDPHSLIQGHAIWHLLCAVSAYGLYRYYAGERPGGPATAGSRA